MFKGKAKVFRGQEFSKLKDEAAKSGALFCDPEFKNEAKSIFFSKEADADIVWKRPGELVSQPKLFVGGASAEDFSQGELGNCWFVAACASIAQEKKLWKKVVPEWEKQEWTDGNKYAGIFHFQFFHLGEWMDVVIDDYLPTRNNKLIFVQSSDTNEFWSALLEKAYAKIFGDYESLKGGHAKDAMVDMMGGVGESIELKAYTTDAKLKDKLFDDLEEAYDNHSLMSASIRIANNNEVEKKLDSGLMAGHAYSITCVQELKLGSGLSAFFKREKIKMIRCRNPWGLAEWTGAWSDGSSEWQKVSDGEKKDIGLVFNDDGEFWMSFDDFCGNFTNIDICHMINTSCFSFRKSWKESVCFSEWRLPALAGGCTNGDTLLQNPQFVVDVTEDASNIMLSLEQEDARIWKERGKKNASIGLIIYKADLNREYRMHDTFHEIKTKYSYIDTRSIFQRVSLAQGRYLIIPSTFDAGHEGRFMLRAYGSKDLKLRELTLDEPEKGGCCGPRYRSASQVRVIKAVGLEKQDIRGGGDPYCIIRTAGQEIKTPVVEDSLSPEWDCRVTFYKSKVLADVSIEVWNENPVRDQHMGSLLIMCSSALYRKEGVQQLPLMGKGKEASSFKPGKLFIEIKHFDQLSNA